LQKNLSNKLLDKLADFSILELTSLVTFAVLSCSMLLVYLCALVFNVEYKSFLLMISIILPLLLTPPFIFIVIKFTKYLGEYRAFLAQEIQKSKEKDTIMYEQERFALMGEMMANISHQWKQPLNTINLSVLSTKLAGYKPDEVEKSFEIIETNVNYLANTVNDFLSFFDKKRYKDLKTLPEILLEVKSIYEGTLIANNIELKIELANDAKDVLVATSIVQIILNLLSNAKDAMNSEDNEQQKKVVLRLITLDNMLKVRCCDAGEGVDEAIMKSIFDPYFTTKEKRQGTGLGLYMSKQIVHVVFNGDIYVDMFNHACFIIDLPYGENCILEKK